ncbi:MAG: glycosyltransferase family 39 protein [Labilithrix sp.]|nr:glycosyltransferase family 39 protein [Labilithrix sp.]
MTHRRVVLALAFASMIAARAIGRFALDDLAHVMDEITYLFQAKLFASGHVSAPVSLPRAAFNMWFIDDRTSRFGIFPPGWPAVLAIGVKLGLERWVNPLLHAATVVIVGRAGERLGGSRLALIAAGLYAVSPQSVLMAGSLMSHTLVALAGAIVLFAAIACMQEKCVSPRLAALAGASVGITAATRPLCAVVLAGAFGAAMLLWGRADRRKLAIASLAASAGALPFVLGLFAFNHATTGSALRFPQMSYFDEHLAPSDVPFFNYRKGCNALGFGPSHGCDLTARGGTHGLSNARENLLVNLRAWLLLLCGPLLVVAPVLAVFRKATRTIALFLLGLTLASFAVYALYWHGGTCFGARFHHATLPAVIVLVALGASVGDRRTLAGFAAITLAWCGVAYTRSVRELTDARWGYWGIDDRFAKLRSGWAHGKAVVMVAFGGDDVHNPKLEWTTEIPTGAMWMLNIRALGALAQNEPAIDAGEIVFAKFHPGLVAEIEARFPDRKLWLFVSNDDRARDVLEPWEAVRRDPKLDPAGRRPPRENFDGFRVEPPKLEQPWMFTPPPDP